MRNVSTQKILFHRKSVIISVSCERPLLHYASLIISLSWFLSLFQHKGPWPAAVRGQAWDGEREDRQRESVYGAGKWARSPPAPEVRKRGNNGIKGQKKAPQIGLLPLARGSQSVWRVCSSYLSHGTTGRALQMGNNCVRVCVYLWVFAGTHVNKKGEEKREGALTFPHECLLICLTVENLFLQVT